MNAWRFKATAATIAAAMAVGFALGGCATAPPAGAPPAGNVAPLFRVAAHEAGVYIIRSERVGGAIPIEVLIDGQRLGATVARSYLYAVVAPGMHTVESRGDIRHALEVELKPGTITYLSQVVELTYLSSPRTRLRAVHEAQGREWVMELKAAPAR